MENQAIPILDKASGSQARSSEVVIRLSNVSRYYGKRLAVNQLNLEVRRGDIFGFLGPNGAGKTTTIRMIFGLISPHAGRIEILGKESVRYRTQVLPRVGALIETPTLYPYLSGRDNLEAIAAVLGGLPSQHIDHVLELVGLHGRQKDRVRTYSLGMKQRLGVAIALLHDPDIVVLDEPANGLDPAGIVEMRDLMYQLAARGKTVFLSSHILSEIQQICSRVAVINRGQLLTEAAVEDLTRGTGEFLVKVEEPIRALALLHDQPWGRKARLDEHGALITPAPNKRGSDLSTFLVKSGFAPETLASVILDLESVFLTMTDSKGGEER
ncbi:ABC transporter ATP-binding protein [Ktedonosporobacter rubrisoli]|uniref:ABC transporter ATP-binding protein n=1 Tax=Ktedonosporobacter rubrisoli TaxID=2509675 RepID=A0A4P6JPT9_KTERU|nr:ABC transporter ATP-binding protein [Ktedonosporobacter rubrisoli]QBD77170.1 ABC transporter ATP-binding protein [Ktedonosporobacter rubrisoli]